MFFENLTQFNAQIAAIEGSEQITYAQLAQAKQACLLQIEEQIGTSGQLILIKAHNGISTLIVYLAILETQHCGVMVDPNINEPNLRHLVEQFQPALIAQCGVKQCVNLITVSPRPTSIFLGEVGLLLSTSGSTGSAKHVALSKQNLHANSRSICSYLPIQASDVTLCSLPFHYSYGLSIINSHIHTGACCVFTDASPVSREYWQLFDRHRITSFAGVPFSYELLLKLKFTQKDLPHLRYFTQAGGKLASEYIVELGQYARDSQKQFFTMYGQTEATARMAYLAPEKVLETPSSIGQPIPDGELKIIDENGLQISAAEHIGEIYYAGPNVMLGYVANRREIEELVLVESTEPKWLATGDLGYRNKQGDFFISGRKSRFIKLVGQRIDLDDSEKLLKKSGYTAICTGDDNLLIIGVIHDNDKSELQRKIKTLLHQEVGIHPSKIRVFTIDEIPLNANLKVNYHALWQWAQDNSNDE